MRQPLIFDFDKKYTVFFVLSVGYLAIHFYAALWLSPNLWGVDQWSYFSLPLSILFFLGGFLLLAGVFFTKFRENGSAPPLYIKRNLLRRHRLLFIALLFIVSGIVFFFLRQKTYFLGDGYFLGRLIEKGIVYRYREFLDLLTHSILYRAARSFVVIDGTMIFGLFSMACGLVIFYVVFRISKILGEENVEISVIYILILFTGSLQLYFGYVENYTTSALFVAVYSYFGLKSSRNSISLIYAGIALSIAMISHISTIALIPSFFILAWNADSKRILASLVQAALKTTAVCIPLIAVLSCFYFNLFPSGESVEKLFAANHSLPLFSTAGRDGFQYPLFSVQHVIDILNETALLTPIGFFALASLVLTKAPAALLKRRDILFFSAAVGFYALEYIVFNKAIGAARDWDIFAALAVPGSILGILMLKTIEECRFSKIGILIAIPLILHTVSWIGVNASIDKSLSRFIYLAENSPWSKYAKGYAYDELRTYFLSGGDDERAMYFADKAVREGVEDARLRLNRANMFVKAGELNRAAREYESIISDTPRYAPAYYRLGTVYLMKRDFRKAEDNLIKAVRLEPDNAEYMTSLGTVYLESGNSEKAELAFEKAIELKPDNFEAYSRMGVVYTGKGDFKKARALYMRLIAEGAGDARVYNNLGNVYREEKNTAEALKAYDRAVELDPRYAEAYRNRGNAFAGNGNILKAEDSYRKALELDSADVKTYNNLALLLLDRKRFDEAEKLLQRALTIDSSSAQVYNNLGTVFFYRENTDDALECFNRAVEIDSGYNDALFNAAVVYLNRKMYGKARIYAEILQKRKQDKAGILLEELRSRGQ